VQEERNLAVESGRALLIHLVLGLERADRAELERERIVLKNIHQRIKLGPHTHSQQHR
jgi:ABC-type molybdate transport system ATPase subunit